MDLDPYDFHPMRFRFATGLHHGTRLLGSIQTRVAVGIGTFYVANIAEDEEGEGSAMKVDTYAEGVRLLAVSA